MYCISLHPLYSDPLQIKLSSIHSQNAIELVNNRTMFSQHKYGQTWQVLQSLHESQEIYTSLVVRGNPLKDHRKNQQEMLIGLEIFDNHCLRA